MKSDIHLRDIRLEDCKTICKAFDLQGWNKPVSQYEKYCREQNVGERAIIVAEHQSYFAGYITIVWQSAYKPFGANNIPEIVDLNVLQKFQGIGIGSALMDEAESRISTRAQYVGIGVGVTADYATAHRLYIKRGYIPDRNGLTKGTRTLKYGDRVTVDDSLVFHFIKKLS